MELKEKLQKIRKSEIYKNQGHVYSEHFTAIQKAGNDNGNVGGKGIGLIHTG